MHELFEKKGIDYDVRDSHSALVQKLLSEIDVDTIKVGNRTIEVDRNGVHYVTRIFLSQLDTSTCYVGSTTSVGGNSKNPHSPFRKYQEYFLN